MARRDTAGLGRTDSIHAVDCHEHRRPVAYLRHYRVLVRARGIGGRCDAQQSDRCELDLPVRTDGAAAGAGRAGWVLRNRRRSAVERCSGNARAFEHDHRAIPIVSGSDLYVLIERTTHTLRFHGSPAVRRHHWRRQLRQPREADTGRSVSGRSESHLSGATVNRDGADQRRCLGAVPEVRRPSAVLRQSTRRARRRAARISSSARRRSPAWRPIRANEPISARSTSWCNNQHD